MTSIEFKMAEINVLIKKYYLKVITTLGLKYCNQYKPLYTSLFSSFNYIIFIRYFTRVAQSNAFDDIT